MPWIAGAILGGGALMAGGSVAGGFLGQPGYSSGDQILPQFDPNTNLTNAAANFDAMNMLGFGDIASLPSPTQRLVGQIQALQLDEKTKRRGLLGLSQLFEGGQITPQLEPFVDAVISRVGVSRDDLGTLMERDASFRQQQQDLQELSGIQTDTVMERARAAQAASQLLGSAASAATGGELTALQRQIRGSLERNLADAEERALLQGRFGGFNPSETLEGIADARGELDLRAIEQSLLLASGLTQGLGGGLGFAQNAQANSNNANLGAAGIAAQQSAAANALQAQVNSESATSLANGIGGGIAQFGNSLSSLGVLYGTGTLGSTAPATGGYINTGNAVNQAAMGQTAPPGGGVLLY